MVLTDPYDPLVDGVTIFGGDSQISSSGKNVGDPDIRWTAALRGITMLGARGNIENDNSWIHTPQFDEDGKYSHYLLQQGVCLVGRRSHISFHNAGTVITGEWCHNELLNYGVAIIGKEGYDEYFGEETKYYNSHKNYGFIICGNAIWDGNMERVPYIEFPSVEESSVYGKLKGRIHLDESCSIWDADGKQIVKDGKLVK